MYFNVFEAAPENEKDGPQQQAQQNASGRVRLQLFDLLTLLTMFFSFQNSIPGGRQRRVRKLHPCDQKSRFRKREGR